MYTLKDVFPNPKKPYKKNFVKENAKSLKYSPARPSDISSKSGRDAQDNEPTPLPTPSVIPSTSNWSREKVLTNTVSKTSMRKKVSPEIKFKKGDMAEFLKRKEQRTKATSSKVDEITATRPESPSRLRDIACQTIESNFPQKPGDQRLTMLYPKDDVANQQKASGDTSARIKSPVSARLQNGFKGDDEPLDSDRKKTLTPTPRMKPFLSLEGLKDKDKDPYLPAGYQKGVLPRYLRERRDEQGGSASDSFDAECPPGHVTLPDGERKETLRMLRNSFAELVNELNKMPVRTDTLRMRARKMELEKQLAKLEEGIKVFSRPKVFVRVGE